MVIYTWGGLPSLRDGHPAHNDCSQYFYHVLLNFIYIGMDWNAAETLLGNPSGHPEVSVAIMNEYDLPFHQSCRIGHQNTGTVSFIGEPGSYPLRGMILPVLFLLLAAIDVGAYFTVGYFQKKRIE